MYRELCIMGRLHICETQRQMTMHISSMDCKEAGASTKMEAFVVSLSLKYKP